jgi:hypothetical protein
LFGLHGERGDWPSSAEQPIGEDLIRRLAEECGIQVLPVPASLELTILEDGEVR